VTAGLGEPKARQVYLVLRDRILTGVFANGARLPNEHDLAEAHGVSRVTVRRALAELEQEQLIERRPSAGTRVIYEPSSAPIIADIAGVLTNLAEMGRRTNVKLLSFGYITGSTPITKALGLEDGAELQRSVRVRSIVRDPFSYLTTHVPAEIGRTFIRAELASQPMLELLERAGAKVEHATQRIGAGLATPPVAEALGIQTGSPLIELVRVVFDRTGRGVEHLHALYRPDRYSIAIDLVRSSSAESGGWKPVARIRNRSHGTGPSTDRGRQATDVT
jgi:GntR family transcriptional regulator